MVEKYGKINLVVTNVGPVLACCTWYEHGYEQWYQGPYQAGMTSGNKYQIYISIGSEVISSIYQFQYQVYTCLIPGKNQPWTQH
jgi:hypothetical protein